jgi:hypothetical protein
MKYNGQNTEGFARDARILLEARAEYVMSDEIELWEMHVRALAHDYGIADTDIWDILPEYTAEGTTYHNCPECGHACDCGYPKECLHHLEEDCDHGTKAPIG